MVTVAMLKKLALELPGSEELPHHGFPSFRVHGKIFATLPDAKQLNVFVDLDEVAAVVALSPRACRELFWGKSLRGVAVELPKATRALVARLLREAWSAKAPRSRARR